MINQILKKEWGTEKTWASTEKYCAKLLEFDTDSKTGMIFHSEKDKTWYILNGKFEVIHIDTSDAKVYSTCLVEGDIWRQQPLNPYQLICIEKGVIIEVGTPDIDDDNYKIAPGDN